MSYPKEWKTYKLGDISIVKGQYGTSKAGIEFEENKPRYIRITDIDDEGLLTKDNIVGVDLDNYDDFRVNMDDLLFARTGATTGKTYIHQSKGEFIYAGFLIRFILDKQIINPYYLWHYTKTERYLNWVRVMSVRTGQPGINSKEYSNLKITVPRIEVQNRIVSILKNLDKEIKLVEEKKDEYLVIKEHVLHKVFKNELNSISLDKISNSIKVPSGFNKLDYLEIGDIDIKTQTYVIKNKKAVSGAKFAPKGSILISTVRPTRGAITILKEDMLVSQAFTIINLNNKNNQSYIYNQLLTRKFKNTMERLSTGSTYPTVTDKDVLSYKVSLDSEINQRKIEETLDNIDKLIKKLSLKINLLKKRREGVRKLLLTGQKELKV